MEEHLPKRPAWDCSTCGETWPCANAKENLLLEYLGNKSSLLLYLTLIWQDAFDDLAASVTIPPELFERFTGWAR